MKKLFTALICAGMVLGLGGCGGGRTPLSPDEVEKHLTDKGYTLNCASSGFDFCGFGNSSSGNFVIYGDEVDFVFMNNDTVYNIKDDKVIEGDGDAKDLKSEFDKMLKDVDVTSDEVSSLLKDKFNSYKSEISAKKAEEESEIHKKGEKVKFQSPDGTDLFEITINSVKATDDRNEFSDDKPEQVVIINYTYKNIGIEEDLYISSPSFQVIDEGDNVLSTYPADINVFPQECPKGTKSDGEEAYGTKTKSKKIRLIVTERDPNTLEEITRNFELPIE